MPDPEARWLVGRPRSTCARYRGLTRRQSSASESVEHPPAERHVLRPVDASDSQDVVDVDIEPEAVVQVGVGPAPGSDAIAISPHPGWWGHRQEPAPD